MTDIVERLRQKATEDTSPGAWFGCYLMDAAAEIERLRVGHERYETARRMNPRAWADAWQLNLTTGKPFDEIIDDLRPFVRP